LAGIPKAPPKKKNTSAFIFYSDIKVPPFPGEGIRASEEKG
jgi:hypothetical protein